jgi:hypothetical protein
MKHLKGVFAGESFDYDVPVFRVFPNNRSCREFHELVSRAIEDRIATCAVGIVGKINECPPPYLVMPLTVDGYAFSPGLNNRSYALHGEGHYQTKLDDKSGYDHALLSEDSPTLVGFQ